MWEPVFAQNDATVKIDRRKANLPPAAAPPGVRTLISRSVRALLCSPGLPDTADRLRLPMTAA